MSLKLFGCTSHEKGVTRPLPNGIFSLFLILWKFIIFAMVQLDEENIPFSHNRIWRMALDRFRERAEALQHAHALLHIRALGRGSSSPPNPATANAALTPLARIEPDGSLSYHAAFSNLVASFEASPDPLPATDPNAPPPPTLPTGSGQPPPSNPRGGRLLRNAE